MAWSMHSSVIQPATMRQCLPIFLSKESRGVLLKTLLVNLCSTSSLGRGAMMLMTYSCMQHINQMSMQLLAHDALVSVVNCS